METEDLSRLRTRDLTHIALLTALMAVCSQIATPKTPLTVPFTFQTFALFAALLMLGGRRGLWVTSIYLLLGAAGLPVFSGFQGGLGVLLGTTGGYLIGFVFSALVYWLVEVRLGGRPGAPVCGCLLGMLAYYAFGTVWFLVVYARAKGPIGLGAALGMCVVPFLIPDLLKLALAVLLARRMGRYLK